MPPPHVEYPSQVVTGFVYEQINIGKQIGTSNHVT